MPNAEQDKTQFNIWTSAPVILAILSVCIASCSVLEIYAKLLAEGFPDALHFFSLSDFLDRSATTAASLGLSFSIVGVIVFALGEEFASAFDHLLRANPARNNSYILTRVFLALCVAAIGFLISTLSQLDHGWRAAASFVGFMGLLLIAWVFTFALPGSRNTKKIRLAIFGVFILVITMATAGFINGRFHQCDRPNVVHTDKDGTMQSRFIELLTRGVLLLRDDKNLTLIPWSGIRSISYARC